MLFSARTLVALLVAFLIVVIAPLLWHKSPQPQQESVQTTTSTSRVDSNSTTIPAPNSVSSRRDSAPKRDISPPSVMDPPAPSRATPGLVIPVVGVTADQLTDTYTQARSNGRVHDAIDIMAPHNSPVVAAAAGRIVRFFQSVRGGNTIYELSPGGDTVYYYAHLDHYADGLAQGADVEQGQLLGYVGDTGDAGAGNYHLHFAIWLIDDPKKFWDGENINPYPILRQIK